MNGTGKTLIRVILQKPVPELSRVVRELRYKFPEVFPKRRKGNILRAAFLLIALINRIKARHRRSLYAAGGFQIIGRCCGQHLPSFNPGR